MGFYLMNSTQHEYCTKWEPAEDALTKPITFKKKRMVRIMSDLFHKEVPFEFIDKVFAVMALCPQHTFQILTKRPERMAEYFHTYNGGPAFSEDQEQLKFRPLVQAAHSLAFSLQSDCAQIARYDRATSKTLQAKGNALADAISAIRNGEDA